MKNNLDKERLDNIQRQYDYFFYLLGGGEGSFGESKTLREIFEETDNENSILDVEVFESIPPKDTSYTRKLYHEFSKLLKLSPTTKRYQKYLKHNFFTAYIVGLPSREIISGLQEVINPFLDLKKSIFNKRYAKYFESREMLNLQKALLTFKSPDLDESTKKIANIEFISTWEKEFYEHYKSE